MAWRRARCTLAVVIVGLALTALLARRSAAQTIPTSATCVACHLQQSDERLVQPARDFESDVHAGLGFGCLDCHGRAVAEVAPSAFLGRPTRKEIPALCGRCHSDGAFMRQYNPSLRVDQVAEYRTSVHGQRLFGENDTSVAVCVSCHPAHAIRAASDPASPVHPLNVATTCGHCHADSTRMAHYGIPTDQERLYETSVHWQWMREKNDLSAPTCNDCHGNHGAAPPGVSSVRAVCGQCHGVMETFFTGSKHHEYFVAANLPGCAACHSNHAIVHPTDTLLTKVSTTVCAKCHTSGAAANAFPDARRLIDSLDEARSQATGVLEQAENVGMEVSDAQFQLEDATNALIQARTAIHSFTVDSVAGQVHAGLAVTSKAAERGREALHEHLFRRQGLVVSVGLILILVAGLALKIRQLETRDAGTHGG